MEVALAGNDTDVDGVLMVKGRECSTFRGRRAKVSSPSCPYDRSIHVHYP